MSYTKTYKHFLISLFTIVVTTTAIEAQTYSGQAAVARASIRLAGSPVFTTGLADTGDLPSNGGNISHATAAAAVPGALGIPSPLAVSNSTSSTLGGAGSSQSSATVASPNLLLFSGGVTITATIVSSSTSAGCPGESTSSSGSVAGLVVNGAGVTVLGTPNQSVALSALGGTVTGTLVINEVINDERGITRNALHATVTGPGGAIVDVVVASSSSGINCGFSPLTNLYGGRGTGLRVRQAGITDVSTILADTGFLPRTGGNIDDSTMPINLGVGILSAATISTGTVQSASSGGVAPSTPTSTNSSSSVENLGVNLLGGTVQINATVLSSDTECQCSLGVPSCSQNSNIVGLTATVELVPGLPVNVPIVVDGSPNQVISLTPLLGGLGTLSLTLNGRHSAGVGDTTAYALRVQASLTGLTDTAITVARSHSDMSCSIAPSAAHVSLSGRVIDRFGRGIPRTIVSISDGAGFSASAVTNNFGHYSIKGIPAGNFYVVSASARGYRFEGQTVSLDDSLSDFNFVPTDGRLPTIKSMQHKGVMTKQ